MTQRRGKEPVHEEASLAAAGAAADARPGRARGRLRRGRRGDRGSGNDGRGGDDGRERVRHRLRDGRLDRPRAGIVPGRARRLRGGRTPTSTVNYTSAGDQLPTQLSTAVEGGNPPDVAVAAAAGPDARLRERRTRCSRSTSPREDVETNLGESAVELGSVDGTLYGFLFKAANKSTVWYNVAAFEDAGVEAPETWDDFLAAAETINASGLPAYSIGGADGWTLTDLFENIYLRTAGPEKYDQLSTHEIPWTDQSVKDALTEMAKIVGDADNIVGGTSGALQTDFPTSVSNVFAATREGRAGDRGRLRAGRRRSRRSSPRRTSTSSRSRRSASRATWSSAAATPSSCSRTPRRRRRSIKYLTTPEAAEIWAERGGFATLNKDVDASVYPGRDHARRPPAALAEAEVFRFDLSDLQPAAFGGTVGQGLFKLFQDFVENPDDIDGITQQMETAAAEAFG